MIRFRSWWQNVRKPATIAAAIALAGIIFLICAVLLFNGTGFNGYTKITTTTEITLSPPKITKTEEYQPGKTLWDWLQLLVIPAVLAFGGFWLNQLQKSREQVAAKEQAAVDRDIAADNQREAMLQEYINKISELLLHEGLRESDAEKEVRKIARVRTLTILLRVDANRQKSILQFLHESGLIDKDKPIVDLRGADLRESNLRGVILSGASLRGADLAGAQLERADLSGADLREAELSGAQLERADLSGADLRKAKLSDAKLERADLSGADLREANLLAAVLLTTTIQKANLEHTYLELAQLPFANLTGANIKEANLQGAKLSDAKLERADLSGTKLGHAHLDFAYMSEANLSGADLTESNLERAQLNRANLTGSNLTETNLRRADLTEANLTGANLSKARLEGAIVTQEQLKMAGSLEGATGLDKTITTRPLEYDMFSVEEI